MLYQLMRLGRHASLFTLCAFLLTTTFQPYLSAQENRSEQAAWGNRGRAAIRQHGRRFPLIAARYKLTPDALAQELERDPNLWIDREERLVYLDEYAPTDSMDDNTLQAAFPSAQTFNLHSRPGATKVIYLDFDGHTTSGTAWNSSFNGGNDIVSDPYEADNPATPGTFSNPELDRIQYIWQRVAEDFLPLDVDVTTEDPGVEALRNLGGSDQNWGIRVVISPTNWYNTGAGGVAYLGSFNWNSDTPCWAFTQQLGNGEEKYVAEAVSHEVGHTLGLFHDGKTDGTAYYQGHGTEPLGWAPIMGVGYYRSITQWSKGEYALANQTQDDLTVMTNGYGIGLRNDDYGDTTGTASALTITNGTTVSGQGVIERATDKDYFSFTTGGGQITLNMTGGQRGPNLDIQAELLNGSGAVVASNNATGLNASITTTVTAGTYFLVVDGVGTGDATTGYSDYGSLGEYNISGTIIDSNLNAPTALAGADVTSGLAPLTVNFSSAGSTDGDGSIVSYAWNFGNSTTSTQANPSTVYTNPGTYTAVLTVTDNDGLTDTANVVITVTALPNAPSGLIATAVSHSQINLAWVDNANNETGFQIERSTDNATWAPLGSVAANVQVYYDGGLSASTLYYYRVRAINASGNSAYSNTANATTAEAPSATDYGTIGDMPVAGTLTGNFSNTTTNNGTAETITEVLSGSTTSSYSYLEHKWRFDVPSGYGTVFYANAWQTASTEGDNFQFAYSRDNVTYTPMFTVTSTADGAYQSFALPSNLSGTLYIRVTDTNRAAGKTTLDQIMVDHLYIRVDNTPPVAPNAPTALAAVPVTHTQIHLSWADNATNESGFQIERSFDGATWVNIGTAAANVTTAASTGLASNMTYYYRVRAYNTAGNSAYSNVASAQTPAPPTLHIGNIDGVTTRGSYGKWHATLTFTAHNAAEGVLGNVTISGTWSNGAAGTGSCKTSSDGRCTITLNNIASTSAKATFTINSVALSGYVYASSSNHDPDSSSNGTIIVLNKP